jgi:hypothetical protein
MVRGSGRSAADRPSAVEHSHGGGAHRHRSWVGPVRCRAQRGPSGTRRYPGSAIGPCVPTIEDGGMEVISPPRATERLPVIPVVGGTLVGTLLVVGGVIMGYVAFATPFLTWLMPTGHLGTGETAIGVVIWAVALVAPAAFIILGATRLARILSSARHRIPRRSSLERSLGTLPEGVVLARGLTLPDGRGVSDMLVGPFGAALIRELPPSAATRVRNGHWELRGRRGWIPLENPLERTSRDAERVRRWLAHDDADFVVKTYAAVIGPAPSIARTTTCAVLAPDQVPAWIAALPAQRSLTPGRIERMLDIVRGAAV